jgi:hypothetical protein
MAIQRRQKLITLSRGLVLTVWESSWEISMARTALEEDARKKSTNKQGELSDQLYFQKLIYAPLAACSTGDVPSMEQAFQLPAEDLDAWFEAAREVDPESYTDEHVEPETVVFRDDSRITVLPDYLPSVLMKQRRLDAAANLGPADEAVTAVTFRVLYYPRLAACSIGDVPTMEEARTQWPTAELEKWYQAVKRVNPQLFLPLEEMALANQAKAQQKEKKKERSRSRSRSTSPRS